MPTCDQTRECEQVITYIDAKGYVYCTQHGQTRQQYVSCRKLRPHELRRLGRGEAVKVY